MRMAERDKNSIPNFQTSAMWILRAIRSRGWALTNCCWFYTKNGTPMVGSKFCREMCPRHRGVVRILFWRFVKCGHYK